MLHPKTILKEQDVTYLYLALKHGKSLRIKLDNSRIRIRFTECLSFTEYVHDAKFDDDQSSCIDIFLSLVGFPLSFSSGEQCRELQSKAALWLYDLRLKLNLDFGVEGEFVAHQYQHYRRRNVPSIVIRKYYAVLDI